MAIKALTPGKVIAHVCRDDVRPPKIEAKEGQPEPDNSEHDNWKPTRWKLKCLDSKILGALKDKATKITFDTSRPNDEVGTEVNQNQYYFRVVQLGLAEEPDNFDTKAKFGFTKQNISGVNYTVVYPDYVGTIPEDVIVELAEAIISGNSLSDEEGNA